jgi:hypothetical protein
MSALAEGHIATNLARECAAEETAEAGVSMRGCVVACEWLEKMLAKRSGTLGPGSSTIT